MVKSEFVRILVIEDEVKLATHLSRALETEGHEARVVHDGKVPVTRSVKTFRKSEVVTQICAKYYAHL